MLHNFFKEDINLNSPLILNLKKEPSSLPVINSIYFHPQYRNLEGNRINFIHENAFAGFTQLEDL